MRQLQLALIGWLCVGVSALAFEATVDETEDGEAEVVEAVPEADAAGYEFSSAGKKPSTPSPGSPLFLQNAPLHVEMRADFETLKNGNQAVGSLSHGKENLKVTFVPRGQYRRDLCSGFPPFKVVRAKEDETSLFKGAERDVKFVTHCAHGSAKEQKFVLAEYTQYKILEASGLPGLRARLAHVTYKDEKGKVVGKGTGFFIEGLKDYARRMGYTGNSKPALSLNEMEARFELSQGLLRNTDYSADFRENVDSHKGHNVRLVLNKEKQPLAYVPYDFDLTSLTGKEDRAEVEGKEAAYNKRTKKRLLEFSGMEKHFQQLVSRKPAMLQAIEQAPIAPAEKQRLRTSIGGFLDELKKK